SHQPTGLRPRLPRPRSTAGGPAATWAATSEGPGDDLVIPTTTPWWLNTSNSPRPDYSVAVNSGANITGTVSFLSSRGPIRGPTFDKGSRAASFSSARGP